MRIKNESAYRTGDVSAILRRALRDVLTPDQRKWLRVDVTKMRGSRSRVRGWGSIGGLYMRLSLGPDSTAAGVAAVAVHEAWHNKGVRHGDMPDFVRYCHRDRYPWADAMPLRLIEVAPRVKPTAADKLAHARGKAAEWERKARLAANRARTWKRRAKRIEYGMKRAAAVPVRWYVGDVSRPDAGGNLYAPVRIENNKEIEHGITPSHDRAAVQAFVDKLNGVKP